MRRLISLLALLAALSPLAAQSFREKVSVELVGVELLATDSGGKPLTNLRESEIRVLVDGRVVPVEGFEAPASGLPALPGARMLSPLAPTFAGAGTPVPVPPLPAPRYLMAFLADDTSSEQSNRQAVYAELSRFLQRGLAPGVEVQLLRFDGRLRVECPWTSDSDLLRRTVATMARHRSAPLIAKPGALSGNPERGSFRIELEAMEAGIHVRTSLAGLFDSLRTFPEIPGHKALYFISDGAPFLASPEIARDLIAASTSSVDPNDTSTGAAHWAALEADMDSDLLWDSLAWNRTRSSSLLIEIARLALLRGIEIHPVSAAEHDLSGRVRTDRDFSDRATANAGRRSDRLAQSRSLRDAVTVPTTDIAAGGSMEATAETTGGDAVLSRRFFDDNLKRDVENRSSFYVVSFKDPFAGDHRFHRVEITSTRAGLKLRYRRGYRLLDANEALLQGAANRLYERADVNPLGVRLEFESLGLEKGQAGARITVTYPVPPQAGGRAREGGSMRIAGFCAVRDGTLKHLNLSGKAEELDSGGTAWLKRSGTIALAPGTYRWSLAIRDETSGITSYLTFDRGLP